MLNRILNDLNTKSKPISKDLGNGIIEHSWIESEKRKNAIIEITSVR